jgi:transposase
MFVRRKKNKSGSVSVQIISKWHGTYKVVHTVGSAREDEAIERLINDAHNLIPSLLSQQELDLAHRDDKLVYDFLRGLNNPDIRTVGPELIFGALFDSIGFNDIADELFRHITIARLVYPTSKLKTVDYLYRYQGITLSEDSVYRFLDRLHKRYKADVERIAYDYSKKILTTISVVFYDMTTLYFETEDEDDLRKIGFSKDGKFQCPQIMLGLLVGEHGYPIGYDIFKGNTFEGHTLIPVLEKIQEKYGFGKPVVVADAALLSKSNLEKLKQGNYTFIVGARIKNESEELKAQILENSKDMKDGSSFVLKRKDGTRLIVTYSEKRARKDAHNRDKGVKKLRAKVQSGKLSKEHINNRGYNKFLTLSGEVEVSVDEARIEADERWDGLKGYVTNTRFSAKKVVEHYSHLWQIERAFRISKTDLRVRPVYHYRKRRIEAHICIAFVAYTIHKELERLLKKHEAGFSVKRAVELVQQMYEIHFRLPKSGKHDSMLLGMSEEQEQLWNIIQKECTHGEA